MKTRDGHGMALVSEASSFGSFLVYNFTVQNDHTYFVGRRHGGLWVHNQGCGGGEDNPPPLSFMHDPGTLGSGAGYEHWSRQPTDAIVNSLKPGAERPLLVRPNGVIADGNTRVGILRDRGIDINTLPRTPANRGPTLDDLF